MTNVPPDFFQLQHRIKLTLSGTIRAAEKIIRTLGCVFPVELQCSNDARSNIKSRIEIDPNSDILRNPSLPVSLEIDEGEIVSVTASGNKWIEFGDHQSLDVTLRGRRLLHAPIAKLRAVRLEDGDKVLARCANIPVWILRTVQGRAIEIISLTMPQLAPNESLVDYFHGGNFIQLLPLVHFLKRIAFAIGWNYPKPRACLMFDDPNLHWPTYGFVSFAEIVRRADRSGYHVSFATVPLDGWYTHAPTARLFREHPRCVSLLMHGNDHLRAELGRSRSSGEHQQLLAQALKRVHRLETKGDVHIARVMAPPHGACSCASMSHMLALGIEGAFISAWSLRDWNESSSWRCELGFLPAEMLEGGFPVAPRSRISTSCEATVVLAALMGRPIVLVGHHQDLKNGVDFLDAVALVVNSLPDVQWTGPEAILRSNYSHKIDNGVLRIRPFAARLGMFVPESVDRLILEECTGSSGTEPHFHVSSRGNVERPVVASLGQAIAVRPGRYLEIQALTLGSVNYRTISNPRPNVRAAMRRVLCETRDRLAPAALRLSKVFSIADVHHRNGYDRGGTV